MAVPTQDPLLVPFSTNMNTRLVASGVGTYHIAAPVVADYTDKHEAFLEAYNAMIEAREAGTRSEAQTILKDATKASLLAIARSIYAAVQVNDTVSDADKVLLGVKIRAVPSPIARPSVAPGLHIDAVTGRIVSMTLHDNTVSPHRSKAPGAVAAWIYSFVGNDYPSNPAEWNFQGACTGRELQVEFENTVPAGAKVWVCAAWINAKQQAGPTSIPLSTNLQGGGSEAEAA